ncbi:MAG TPA: hypothetical protein VEW95_05860 [Candidatus Limnocylindrales bacterium]|nr:hypothetical protein [Candidatus Limnocylindrales bacterium]
MDFHEQLQVATGMDPTLIGVGLFIAIAFVLWTLTHLIDRPAQGLETDPGMAPDTSDLELV